MIVALATRTAQADPRGDITAKLKQAMENYDGMDYDAAKKLLNQALATAKKAKLDKDPIVAKAYLDLGIVSFANSDADAAKLSFLSAVQIDPKIQIDAAYKSPDMVKLLDQARSEAGPSSGGGNAGGGGAEEPLDLGPAVDCGSVKGLQHTIIDTAKTGRPLPIEAELGKDVSPVKVSVMYRVAGATDFKEIAMTKSGGCKYTASIPASAMKGSLIHYYVAAFDGGGKPLAAKGSNGSPNIIELEAGGPAAPVKGDDEDPIAGKAKVVATGGGGGNSSSEQEVHAGVDVGPHHQHVMLAISAGPGSGYVTGTTEGMNTVKNCCFGGMVLVLEPELAYLVNPQLSVGVAARIGLPLGANVAGHATAAPGGVVRVRYALAESGEGLRVMGEVGVGILRNTIKLDNSMPGMDTDVVAQGPLLIGGGIGYMKRLSGSVCFIADVSALAGIAVAQVASLSPTLNSGISADLSLGLAVGF